jgi:hypothetical protein
MFGRPALDCVVGKDAQVLHLREKALLGQGVAHVGIHNQPLQAPQNVLEANRLAGDVAEVIDGA